MRILVAMSGGGDSSVAALLLKESGHEVLGATLNLWSYAGRLEPYNNCCSLEVAAVARQLGIEHRFLDYGELFKREVVEYFVREYLEGRTPNPCIRCNTLVRFPALLAEAEKLGCEYLATGHHARVSWCPYLSLGYEEGGVYCLMRGRDPEKDQSYFLYGLTQGELGRLLFPIGDYHKREVLALAREAGLKIKERESQDLCFVPHGDYRSFLYPNDGHRLESSRDGIRLGEIVDLEGRMIGCHKGLPFYTIGQRKGLGLATAERLYVTALDPQSNRVIVGPEESLYSKGLIAKEVNWIAEGPAGEIEAAVKVRYRSRPVAAQLEPLGEDRVKVIFKEPQRAVTPGQAAVFYRGELVLGGGVIFEALNA
jgi:tRNA-specific 2-thiouridylase